MASRDDGPLRVMFIITSMEVGGAETVMAQLLEGMDRARFAPELCCLKRLGPLGEQLASRIPSSSQLLEHKFDLRVWPRLTRLLRDRHIDAVVTFGTGDKMFWGRLAAAHVGVPVVVSALHSTGWPERIGRLNRLLTPLTDVFVAVAGEHGRYLVEQERLPAEKVFVIHNGVDTQRFHPRERDAALGRQLGLPPDASVIGTVGMLRPEKNHGLFLRAARRVADAAPKAHFLIAGGGPERVALERQVSELQLRDVVHFLGRRSDVPQLLSLFDVFVLTSHVEANPVSVLEAMASAKPVVSTRVGSVVETVDEGRSGFLVDPGDEAALSRRLLDLLDDPERARQMGRAGRELVSAKWTQDGMITAYQDLVSRLWSQKSEMQRASEVRTLR